ncbi:MAG: hypothetical protein Q8P84_08615 [Deltaproteobacteria bacterium]|nr:hypothetical protein [Deltaproteobacteria bacterium]MDZ4224488.1 hypothetical protein [bacterium]
MTDSNLTSAAVGAAFGAVMGGASLLMSPNPDKPRRSQLRGVYKDLLKYRYRVVKQYESNRDAQVVLALEKGSNRQVILKLPKPTMDRHFVSFRSGEIRREYETIIAIRKKTDSSHVAKVIDFFSGGDGENYWFICVLEYVAGPTLREEIDKGLLTLARLKEIFPSLAEGLMDVYKAGYDHGDLKPENVILNPERGAVLIDFQFANHTDRPKWALDKWCELLCEAITGRERHFGPADTVRSLLEARGALQPSEVASAEALQKIIDRALQKPGVIPYSDFDSFVKELHQWETSQ